MTLIEFVELYQGGASVEEIAKAHELTARTAKSLLGRATKRGLLSSNGNVPHREDHPVPPTQLPDDSMAAYAACAFDLCGDFSSRLNADPARRIMVKAKLVTTQKAVLDVVRNRYGGEIAKSGDAVVSAYVLTWPDEMVLHGFLSAIVAYSVRWREQIQPVLSYLEQYALLKMYEVELIRMLESKSSGK